MEALRKTVTIGCLTYGLYGLISLFELGTFVPPIPIKPFVFATFLIAYVSVSRQDNSPLLRIALLVWLITLIFVGQYFAEIFFDFDTVDFYINTVEPFVLMFSISAFVAMNYKLVRELGYSSIKYYLLIVISGMLIPLTIVFNDQIMFDWGMVTVAFLFFIFERMNKGRNVEDKYEKVFFVLNGVAVITIIERITYLL